MKSIGHVKWFNDSKNYGFITSNSCEEDIFVHFTSIQVPGHKALTEGQMVIFELETGERGPTAQRVVPVKDDDAESDAESDTE